MWSPRALSAILFLQEILRHFRTEVLCNHMPGPDVDRTSDKSLHSQASTQFSSSNFISVESLLVKSLLSLLSVSVKDGQQALAVAC